MDELDAIFAIDDDSSSSGAAATSDVPKAVEVDPFAALAGSIATKAEEKKDEKDNGSSAPAVKPLVDTAAAAAAPPVPAPQSLDVDDFLAELDSVIASASAAPPAPAPAPAPLAAPIVAPAPAPVLAPAPAPAPALISVPTTTTTTTQAEPPQPSVLDLEDAVAAFSKSVEEQSDAATPAPPAAPPVASRKKGWDEESLHDLKQALVSSHHPEADMVAGMCLAGMQGSGPSSTASAGTGSGTVGIPSQFRARVWELLLSSMVSATPSPHPHQHQHQHQRWEELSPLVSSAISTMLKEGLLLLLGPSAATSSSASDLLSDGTHAVTAAVLQLTNELLSSEHQAGGGGVFAPVPSGLVPLACSLFFALSEDEALVEQLRAGTGAAAAGREKSVAGWIEANLRRLVHACFLLNNSNSNGNGNSASASMASSGLHDCLRSLLVYVEPKLVSRLDKACPGWCQPHDPSSSSSSSTPSSASVAAGLAMFGAGTEDGRSRSSIGIGANLSPNPNACIPSSWLESCFLFSGGATQAQLLPLFDRLILSLHSGALARHSPLPLPLASASTSGAAVDLGLSLSLVHNVPALALPALLMAAVLVLQESAGLFLAASSAAGLSLPGGSPTSSIVAGSTSSSSPAAYLIRMTLKGALSNRLAASSSSSSSSSAVEEGTAEGGGESGSVQARLDPVSAWLVDAQQLSRRFPTSSLSALQRRCTRALLLPSASTHSSGSSGDGDSSVSSPSASGVPSAVAPTSISAEELSCVLLYGFDVMVSQRNNAILSSSSLDGAAALMQEVEGVSHPAFFPLLTLSSTACKEEEVQVQELIREQQEEEQAEAVIRAAEEAQLAAEEAAAAEAEQRRLEGEAAEKALAASTTAKGLDEFVTVGAAAAGDADDSQHHDEEAARAAAVVGTGAVVGPTGTGTALHRMREAAKAAYTKAQLKASKLQEEMKKRKEQALAAKRQQEEAAAEAAKRTLKKGPSFFQGGSSSPSASSAAAGPSLSSSLHWLRPARFLVVDLRPISHRKTGRMATAFHIDPRTIRLTDTSDDAMLALSPKPAASSTQARTNAGAGAGAGGDEDAEEDKFADSAKAAAAAESQQKKLAEEPSEASAYSAEGLPLKVAIAQIVAMCRSADEEEEDNKAEEEEKRAASNADKPFASGSGSGRSKRHYSTTDASGAVHIAVLGVSPSEIHQTYLNPPALSAAASAAAAAQQSDASSEAVDSEEAQRRREAAFFDAVDEDRAKSLAVARALIEAGCRRVSIVEGGFSRIHKQLKEPLVYLPTPCPSTTNLRYRTVIMHHAPSKCPYCRHAKIEKALASSGDASSRGANSRAAATLMAVRGNLSQSLKSWRSWAQKTYEQRQQQQLMLQQHQAQDTNGNSNSSNQWREALGQFLAATSTTSARSDGAEGGRGGGDAAASSAADVPLGQYLPGQAPNKLAQNLDAALDTLEERALLAAKRITELGMRARQQLFQAFDPQLQQQSQQQQQLPTKEEPKSTPATASDGEKSATAAAASSPEELKTAAPDGDAPSASSAKPAATATAARAVAKSAWGNFLAAGAAVLSAPPASNPAAIQKAQTQAQAQSPAVAAPEPAAAPASAATSSAAASTPSTRLTFSSLKAAASAAASAATAAAAGGMAAKSDKDGSPAGIPAPRPSLSGWFSKKEAVPKAAPSATDGAGSSSQQRSRSGSAAAPATSTAAPAPPDPEAAVRLLELAGLEKGSTLELQRFQAYTHLFRAIKDVSKKKNKEKDSKKEQQEGEAGEAAAASEGGGETPSSAAASAIDTKEPRYLCLAKERLLVLEAHPTKMNVAIVKSNCHVSSLAKMTFAKKNPNRVTLWKRKAAPEGSSAETEVVLAERVYWLEGEGTPGETFRSLLVEAINRLK